jgi:hypothetical protein
MKDIKQSKPFYFMDLIKKELKEYIKMVLILDFLRKLDVTEEEHILLMIRQNHIRILKNVHNSTIVIVCLYVKLPLEINKTLPNKIKIN